MASKGLDDDPHLLELAEREKTESGSTAEFFSGDMRMAGDLLGEERFDVITCWGNTIAHLESPGEVSLFLRTVYSLLIEGGVFSGQLVNYENPNSVKSGGFNVIETDEFRFSRKNSAVEGEGKIEFDGEFLLKKSGKRFSNQIVLTPLKKEFIEHELNNSGFVSVQFYGDFDWRDYSGNNNALIFTGVK